MDAIKALLIKAMLRITAALPLNWARALGRGVGRLQWLVRSKTRKITEINIALAFSQMPAAERASLARDSVLSTAELMTEMGHVWMRSADYVRSLVKSVNGAELVTDAVAEGRGVIVLGPHLGNWEMAGLHLAGLGKMVVLYEPPKLAAIGALIERSRERTGGTVVPTDYRGVASLLRSVKRGAISVILPDQVPGDLNGGRNVEFFGVPCFTGTLSSNMLQRSGALAVFAYARRIPGGFEMNYLPAPESIYSDDIDTSLIGLNQGVEYCVRRCPTQYQWEYRRFRTRPKQAGVNPYAAID